MAGKLDLPKTSRSAARAIIFKDDEVLVMLRQKNSKKYVTLVGGRLEDLESPEQAVTREVAEETGVIIKNPQLVFVEDASANWGKQYLFLCEYVSGTPKLMTNSEEFLVHSGGGNTYEPVWLKVSDLEKNTRPMKTEIARQQILELYKKLFLKG